MLHDVACCSVHVIVQVFVRPSYTSSYKSSHAHRISHRTSLRTPIVHVIVQVFVRPSYKSSCNSSQTHNTPSGVITRPQHIRARHHTHDLPSHAAYMRCHRETPRTHDTPARAIIRKTSLHVITWWSRQRVGETALHVDADGATLAQGGTAIDRIEPRRWAVRWAGNTQQ
jgi:hypothetical protein